MYNVSTDYAKTVQQSSREWDVYMDVTLADGTQLRLSREDLGLGSVALKEGATCSDTLQVGSVYSNSVKFSIMNDEKQHANHDFYGAKVKPYVGLLVKGTYNYIPLGVFNILEPVKKMSTIPVTCFDNMSLTNKVFDFSSITFPASCITIFNEVLQQCGIQATAQLTNEISSLKYQINSLLTNEPKCRDVLAGFGMMLSKNLRFSRDGTLESFWYTKTTKTTTQSTRVNNSSYSDQLIKITGVYLSDTYGNTFSTGTSDYPVELPTSPIVQGEEMSMDILKNALSKLQVLQYRSTKIDYIGDPAVQAGDIIEHQNTAVGNISLPVMRVVFKLAGVSTLESLGSSEASQKQQTSTDRKVDRAFNKVDETRKVLESKIEQTADNIKLEVSETYADKQSVAALEVRADQVDIDIKTINEEGITTSMGHSFTNKGMNVHATGDEINTTISNNGMTIMRDDTEVLKAYNKGVDGENFNAKKYITVGDVARLERYQRGSDRNRVALFILGGGSNVRSIGN